MLDSAYLSADNVEFWRELELHYAQQAKKNTKINLKGREEPLGRYFPKRCFHRRMIDGKIVYYAESNLNLKSYGQNRVFAIKGAKKNGEPKKKAKYFITNLRKAMPETILKIILDRWWIEQTHKDLKQNFGLGKRFVREKKSLYGHFSLSYFLYNAFSAIRAKLAALRRSLSLKQVVTRFILFVKTLMKRTVEFGRLYSEFGCS